MYEAHFGLNSPPFQLNPDPSFYFDSRGHGSALAYLKYGVSQGEGFIVVTGDIGAGKTTLVRTLLGVLDQDKIVAAQVVSSQLESVDLLYAINTAFGIPIQGNSKGALLASLEAFLMAVAAQGKRTLLIVDEAQNLHLQSIEELRMLSNFQLGNKALMQSFLVGQPELRKLLESKALEQFRQRVIASCHLGPLQPEETRSYIEHRLHKAGWKGRPAFGEGVFEAVHHATRGTPRRINILCNRLLLATYLSGAEAIEVEQVRQVAREIGSEIGELVNPAPAAMPPVVDHEPHEAVVAPPKSAVQLDAPRAALVSAPVHHAQSQPLGEQVLVVLGDNASARRKAGALARAFAKLGGMPSVVFVNPGPQEATAQSEEDDRWLPQPDAEMHLGVSGGAFGAMAAQVLMAFEACVLDTRPQAVLVLGSDDGVLCCALAAVKRGVTVVRGEAGQRTASADGSTELNGALLERMASVQFTGRLSAHYMLYREGIPSEQVHNVGDLVHEVLAGALPCAIDLSTLVARRDLPGHLLRAARGYGLVVLTSQNSPADVAELMESLHVLVALSHELPLVWALDASTRALLEQAGADRFLAAANIVEVQGLGYLEQLGLLVHARLLITGASRVLVEEAVALGLPSISLGTSLLMAAKSEDGWNTAVGMDPERALRAVKQILAADADASVRQSPDGEVAARMARHVRKWARRRRVEGPHEAPVSQPARL